MAEVGFESGIAYPRERILTEGPTEVNAPIRIVSQNRLEGTSVLTAFCFFLAARGIRPILALLYLWRVFGPTNHPRRGSWRF